jgi:ABC-2 type transport system ATP-binding protein
MGSVEELCDNITLIDHGKTLLEGRVDEIRNSWAGNEYDLVFTGNVSVTDNSHYSIVSQAAESGKTAVRIKAPDRNNTNEIISDMLRAGNIESFNPALPSMNDIFIRVVESKGAGINNNYKKN